MSNGPKSKSQFWKPGSQKPPRPESRKASSSAVVRPDEGPAGKDFPVQKPSGGRRGKVSLSSNITTLSFMKRQEKARRAARAERAKLRQMKEQKWKAATLTSATMKGKSSFIVICDEESTTMGPRGSFSRKSFGFNRNVEQHRIAISTQSKYSAQLAALDESAVSDHEMAQQFGKHLKHSRNRKRKSPGHGVRKPNKSSKRRFY